MYFKVYSYDGKAEYSAAITEVFMIFQKVAWSFKYADLLLKKH